MERNTSTQKALYLYSPPHRVYSRIDYFFTFKTDRHIIIKCEIRVKDISDHTGVYMTINLHNKKKTHYGD